MSSHVFRIGDRVRIKSAHEVKDELCGLEATYLGSYTPVFDMRLDCKIKVDGEDGERCASTEILEPLNPPKQQETITWDEACFDRDGKFRIGVAA